MLVVRASLMTTTVQEITSLTLSTVDDLLVCPTHDSVDDTDGVPNTANENELPDMAAPLLKSFSVIRSTAVITDGAVRTKLKVLPALVVVKMGLPLPLGPYTGVAKSVDNPVESVIEASFTVTVHEITSLTCTYVVEPLN